MTEMFGLFVLLAVTSQVAHAADEVGADSALYNFIDAISPYVSVAYAHDSNLFRLPDELRPENGFSDEYATLAGGFDWKGRASQQEFLLQGFVYRNEYHTYDDLDYTGGKATAQWDWSGGRRLDGALGYKYKKELRSFENQLSTRKDLKKEKRWYASINNRIGKNWVVGLRGRTSDISFSESPLLDLDRNVFGVAFNYQSRAGNTVGFDTEYTKGNYDKDSLKDFDELDIGPIFDWDLTEKTKLKGKVGYSSRDYDDDSRQDYDDVTGRLTLVRKGPKGSKLTAELWRELSNLNDEIANFARVFGFSLEPKWAVSDKVNVSLFLSYEKRDFKGEGLVPAPPNLSQRDDDVYEGSVTADWQINRVFSTELIFSAEKRSSNRDIRDYDFRNIQASLTAKF